MRIGIDARLYGSSRGGIGRYAQNLIKQLEQLDKTNQYFVFLAKDNFDDYDPLNKNFQKVLADFRVYSVKEQLLFPELLKKYKLDLVHFTHFNVPISYSGKFVVTIHDLIISHYPDRRATTLNPLFYKLKLFLYNIVVKSAAKRAKKIIAVSEFTKKDVIKLLKINPEKITVTYEGVDLPKDSRTDPDRLKSKLGVTKDFLLYVGSAYPHKNLKKLLEAFKQIIVDNDWQLVLVGKKNYFYEKIADQVGDLFLEGKVILTDYLSDDELACLYQTAQAYIFPSLIEGFGLPPLEAQSYDLPVISSNAACLPEILGDSAIYFDPKDVENMARVIIKAVTDEDLMEGLRMNGRENLKKYSWRKCAEETFQLYTK